MIACQSEQLLEKISTIIRDTNEIIFETDFLVLKSGVEAVRAGKAGKGFAVVDQDVRSLVQLQIPKRMGRSVDLMTASRKRVEEPFAPVAEMAEEQRGRPRASASRRTVPRPAAKPAQRPAALMKASGNVLPRASSRQDAWEEF